MNNLHHYQLTLTWTGNTGKGTSSVLAYERSHTVSMPDKPDLFLTTDNAKVGDRTKHNPEDLLVTALSSCHMMSYLYLCALEGITITDYVDHATGTMVEEGDGGHFTEVVLNPEFYVASEAMVERAVELHHKAHEICYIANSVNFPVITRPVCKVRS